jgi:hypothetical protein
MSQPTKPEKHNSHFDRERDKMVYAYLLTLSELDGLEVVIAGLNHIKYSKREELKAPPNETALSNQWGLDRATAIRRILRFVLPNLYEKNQDDSAPALTLARLVFILTNLEKYWAEKESDSATRKLKESEKTKAIQLFFQLSREEIKGINLENYDSRILMQKLFDDLSDFHTPIKQKEVMSLYQSFISKWKTDDSEMNFNDAIKEAERIIGTHYPSNKEEKNTCCQVTNRVKEELSRISLQNGYATTGERSFFSKSFIEKVTMSALENHALASDFPIQIKYVEVKKLQPLPLYINTDSRRNGVLNSNLFTDANNSNGIIGFTEDDAKSLENQFVYKVRVYFSIVLPSSFQKMNSGKYMKVVGDPQERQLHFHEEVQGIGSPLSHVIAAINRILLEGISSLSHIIPVASDLINSEESIGTNRHSAVWSHNVVQLHLKEDIDKSKEAVISFGQIAHGDACGFDLIETIAKSSLYSRLRAIKNAGINPKKYLKELCEKLQEYDALLYSKKLLKSYPFSLKAMEGHADTEILNHYLNREEMTSREKPWSINAYAAHLNIISAYLQHGLHACAKRQIDVLDKKMNDDVVDDLTRAKYQLYKARYHHLSCTNESSNDEDEARPYSSYRRTVEKLLSEAAKSLDNYLRINKSIEVLTNSNLHPFFSIRSQIFMVEAELKMFHSTTHEGLLESLKLFENAKICAAKDGNSSMYSYLSAYQSWGYLIVGDRFKRDGIESKEGEKFTIEVCIDWAQKVLDHSITCYYSEGKACFEEIKERGGNKDKYGLYEIGLMPFIQEMDSSKDSKEGATNYNSAKKLLDLDVTQLRNHYDAKDNKNSVYLFGTYSSIILLAKGILGLFKLVHKEECVKKEERKKEIRRINQLFIYSFAIAEDGLKKSTEPNVFERCFSGLHPDASIGGLYPFRLTQFADFGKIFSILCQLFILHLEDHNSNHFKASQKLIETLKDELSQNETDFRGDQKKYNIHMQDHYKQLLRYLQGLKAQPETNPTGSIEEAWRSMLSDFFYILCGRAAVPGNLIRKYYSALLEDFDF